MLNHRGGAQSAADKINAVCWASDESAMMSALYYLDKYQDCRRLWFTISATG
jgi:hypothetical protein